jgi:hypothetical protein
MSLLTALMGMGAVAAFAGKRHTDFMKQNAGSLLNSCKYHKILYHRFITMKRDIYAVYIRNTANIFGILQKRHTS